MGILTTATMRVGTEAVGVCGESNPLAPYTPYGNGLGLLEPGKQLHWRLSAEYGAPFGLARGRAELCGIASVPLAQVPEIGTAGACDSPAVRGGRGRLFLDTPFLSPRGTHDVEDVSSTPTGSVVVVSGRLLGAPGEQPGSLFLLLQRRTYGMCAHKNHEATRVGTTYPQGGKSADLTGVIAYQLPRASVGNAACEDWWGKVRRHLRGAGAGLECPVPSEI